MPEKNKRGRVTPPKSGTAGPPAGGRGAPQRRVRRFAGPNVPIDGPVQAGRRPSNPIMLFVLAAMWIGCGVVAVVVLKSAWKLIPGIVFIGVGLLFFRGAAATVARRGGANQRPGDEPGR